METKRIGKTYPAFVYLMLLGVDLLVMAVSITISIAGVG